MLKSFTIVLGQGEVGRPLADILSTAHDVVRVDIQPVASPGPCRFMHVAIPFQIPDFIQTTEAYIRKYAPEFVVVNSTVAVGTSSRLAKVTSIPVFYSPVRGKHFRTGDDMLKYKKFVAGPSEFLATVRKHFEDAGLKTDQASSTDVLELMKLCETTWLGIMVGWAQEMEQMALKIDSSYNELERFNEEVAFIPQGIFPGVIGGHCVLPNIKLLQKFSQSNYFDAILESNERKIAAGEREKPRERLQKPLETKPA